MFKGVTIIPLTTNISIGNLRVNLNARNALTKESDICINELCTLNLTRIRLNTLLTTLTDNELTEVEQKLKAHLAL